MTQSPFLSKPVLFNQELLNSQVSNPTSPVVLDTETEVFEFIHRVARGQLLDEFEAGSLHNKLLHVSTRRKAHHTTTNQLVQAWCQGGSAVILLRTLERGHE